MNIKKVRRWFLILVVSSCLAVVLLIVSGYRFPRLYDHTLLLDWKNSPSQQGVRGVTPQARYPIPGQTREPVDSIHFTKNHHVGIHESKYAKKDSVSSNPGIPRSDVSEMLKLIGNQIWKPPMDNLANGKKNSGPLILDNHGNQQTNLAENTRDQEEDETNEDDFKHSEAETGQIDATHDMEGEADFYDLESSVWGLRSAEGASNSDASGESWIVDQQTEGGTQHQHQDEDDFYHSESLVSNFFSTKSPVNFINVSKESWKAKEQTEDETKQQHHHPDKPSILESSLSTESFKRKVEVHHRQFQRSKGFRNQPVGRDIGVNKDEYIRHFAFRNTSSKKMFSMKEDVVMELMPKYTNMHPVSQTEFLQLKADGILRRNISRELFNLAPEVFLKTPLTFSRQTRGQCWFVNDVSAPPNQRMRCLPYFYVMGMPKCGTTDLYAKIVRHPSAVNLLKEPHWWAKKRVGRGIIGAKRRLSYNDYLHHFSDVVEAVFTNRKPKIFVGGDGSASTMWYILHHIGVKDEPDYPALPEIIREIQPEVKLIAMLREPVQRLYSDYMYFHHKMVNANDLHNLVEASISNFTRCTKLNSPRYCAGKRVRAQGARVTVGLYSVFLVDWLKVFPRDRILILRLRDWNADCLTLLPKVYAFLEIETLSDKAIKMICNSMAQNVNKKKKFPMLNATAELLSDFYRPYNEDLADLLQDDRFLWLD